MPRVWAFLSLLLFVAACGSSTSTTSSTSSASASSASASSASASTSPESTTPSAAKPALPAPPVARVENVVDEQFGMRVVDPYRWMEGNDNAERDAWMRAHGAYATAWLGRIATQRALLERIRSLGREEASAYYIRLAGGRTFYFDHPAGADQPKLAVREADGSSRVLVDPMQRGKLASIGSYSVSRDGELVAYHMSIDGSEIGVIEVVKVDTGERLPDVVENIWGEFAVSWLDDNRGFYYTQMAPPAPGVDPIRNMKARFHMLGKPGSDVDVLRADASAMMNFAPQEFPSIQVEDGWALARATGARPDTRTAVAKLARVDHSGRANTRWRTIAEYDDATTPAFVRDGRLYLRRQRDTPNGILVSVPLAAPVLASARLEVAEDPNARLSTAVEARDALYYVTTTAGRSTLYRKPWRAARASVVALPYEGHVERLASDPRRDGVLFSLTSWTRPDAYFAYDPAHDRTSATAFATTTTADFSGIVAELVEATSADGTRVPLSIIRRRDQVLDGRAPAILTGYGGYGSSYNPFFDPTRLAWLERGGVIAFAHVRGGGEKGRQWYLDGKGAKKANGVADLVACGEYLIAKGFTRAGKLAVQGRSMGGVLVGMALMRRPDLFASVYLGVGMVNPSRLLHADNGANQIAELGDPNTKAGYEQLLAMDPFHHVADKTAYPATLFAVGLRDKRVAPWMTAKLAARLLAATSSKHPVLIRIDAEGGHGGSSGNEQLHAELADRWSFFLAAAGEPGFQRE